MGIAMSGATPDQIPERLAVFEKIRKNRASVMQIFSNAGQEEPEKIHEEASKYIPADTVPSKFHYFLPPFFLLRLLGVVEWREEHVANKLQQRAQRTFSSITLAMMLSSIPYSRCRVGTRRLRFRRTSLRRLLVGACILSVG